MPLVSAWLATTLIGCGGFARPGRRTAGGGQPTCHRGPGSNRAIHRSRSTASTLLEGKGDFDGEPGDEPLVLHEDGTLAVGEARGKVELTGASDYWMAEQAKLSVAVLDASTRIVVVELPDANEEDPANRRPAVREGGRRPEADPRLDPRRVRVPPPSPSRATAPPPTWKTPWTACTRDGAGDEVGARRGDVRDEGRAAGRVGAQAQRQDPEVRHARRVPLRVRRDGRRRAARGRDPAQTCAGLRRTGSKPSRSRRSRWSDPGPDCREKPEITYLDAVALSVDGVLVPPCGLPHRRSALCAADQQLLRLEKGDAVELRFDVPDDATGVEIVAWGYYVAHRDW